MCNLDFGLLRERVLAGPKSVLVSWNSIKNVVFAGRSDAKTYSAVGSVGIQGAIGNERPHRLADTEVGTGPPRMPKVLKSVQ